MCLELNNSCYSTLGTNSSSALKVRVETEAITSNELLKPVTDS